MRRNVLKEVAIGAVAGAVATVPMSYVMELLHQALPKQQRHPLPPRGDGGGEGELPPGEPLREPRREDRDAVQRAPAAGVQAAVLPEVPRVPRPGEELSGEGGPREGDDDVRGVRGRPAVPVRAGAEREAGPGSVARRHIDLPRLAGHVLPEFEDPQGQQEEDQARGEEEGEDLDVAEEPEPAVDRVRREDEPAGEVEPVRERDSTAEGLRPSR